MAILRKRRALDFPYTWRQLKKPQPNIYGESASLSYVQLELRLDRSISKGRLKERVG
jgi:hypothetical protein